MFRSTHRFRRFASTVFILALGSQGCGYVRDYMTWRRHGAEADALRSRTSGDDGALQSKHDKLRDARARAWASVAKGGAADGYSADDALALSVAARALDARVRWTHVPAAGRATLADLPRSSWWYLAVPPSAWSRGPLAIDRERMPGSYAAMMDALGHIVATAKPGAAAPTTEAYVELHRLATLGVFDRTAKKAIGPGFTQTLTRYPVAALHDLGALHIDHLALALAELKAEGVAGWNAGIQRDRGVAVEGWLAKLLAAQEDINPHNKPTSLVYQRAATQGHVEEWLVGVTTYGAHEAEQWAAQWLADYAKESQAAPRRSADDYLTLLAAQPASDDFTMALRPGTKPSEELAAVLRPIAKLVRRMQVSHLFGDSVDAVDTRLLLNYLLATNGLPPTIVEDGTIFGGREPLDELVAEIIKGQQRYQVLVRELAMREVPEPAPQVAK